VFDERGTGLACAGDDVHDARREVSLLEIFASKIAVSGVVSAGLSTHGVAASERGRELPRRHQQREVPRDDLAGDAERPGVAAAGKAY
jgi:hypothetical protein